MTLSSYDQDLLGPLASGGGGSFYDFETMYTRFEHYPFKTSSGEPPSAIMVPRHVSDYVHEALHHQQHLATTIGFYQALCRQQRINTCLHGLRLADKDALRAHVLHPDARRRPLLDRRDLPALREASGDPLAPDTNYAFRILYYRLLVGEKLMLMHSALSEADRVDSERNITSSLIDTSIFCERLRNGASVDVNTDSLAQIFANGMTAIRYVDGTYRRPLDTVTLMEGMCSAWEICILHVISPELARLRFEACEKNDYLIGIRYACWRLGIQYLPFNVHKYAPELVLMLELALNPPLPGIGEAADAPLHWTDIYPPTRFEALVRAAHRIGNFLELGNHSSEKIQARASMLCHEAKLPVAFVGDLRPPKSAYQTVADLMGRGAHPEDSKLGMGDTKWIMWYLWLQDRYLTEVASGSRWICDRMFNGMFQADRNWEPPVGIDADHGHFVADYVSRNPQGALLFALENLQTYMVHDLMLGRGAVAPLPFGVGEDALASWQLIDQGQYTDLVKQRLGFH